MDVPPETFRRTEHPESSRLLESLLVYSSFSVCWFTFYGEDIAGFRGFAVGMGRKEDNTECEDVGRGSMTDVGLM